MAEPTSKQYDTVQDPRFNPLNLAMDIGGGAGYEADVIRFVTTEVPAEDPEDPSTYKGVYTTANEDEQAFLDAVVTARPDLITEYVEPEE